MTAGHDKPISTEQGNSFGKCNVLLLKDPLIKCFFIIII